MTQKTSPSSNIYLFFGEDDFSLRRKIDFWKTEFAKKYSASAVTFFDGENLGEIELIKQFQNLLAPSLFSSKKLIIVRDCLPTKATQTVLADFLLNLIPTIPADYFLIFWQTKRPDRRLGFIKKFLTSGITITEFDLPHGPVLDQWIKAMAKTLGVGITDAAVDQLARFLGRDLFEEKKAGGRVIERKEAFDLWQVYSELLKLSSLSSQILPEHVQALVRAKVPDSVFALTDEMVARNQKGAFQALENYMSTATIEEKTTLIKVVGLLSEQIRSLLVVGLLQKAGSNNEEIAERLGWSGGRVFITAKNLRNISLGNLKLLLAQLLTIDTKIKSTDTNVALDIDLFLVQATS